MARRDFTGAGHHAGRSAELFAELGDRWGRLQASFALGVLGQIAGDYKRAAGLRVAEGLGLWPEVSCHLSWLGRIALLSGELGEATELHEQARRLAAEHAFKPGEIYAETGLALGARREAGTTSPRSTCTRSSAGTGR